MVNKNKNNPIFLLSLVDFFIQITFLFVILFCIYLTNKASINEKIQIYIKVKDVSEHHNYKTPIDFINDLSTLSSTNFLQLNEILKIISLDDLNKLLNRAGGKEGLNRAVDKQFGAMPCDYKNDASGRVIPKRIASFVGTDHEISLLKINDTEIFLKVLEKYNIKMNVGDSLPTEIFKSIFAPIKKNETCVHYVNFIENTKFIYSRDAILKGFTY